MDTLIQLLEYGQSYWLDNLTRKKITGGELKKRVFEQGLRGITSNPSIFNKAISNSEDYQEQIESLVEEGRSPQEIYEALTVKDVQDACDILKPVFDESGGVDGFVSLEREHQHHPALFHRAVRGRGTRLHQRAAAPCR